MLPNTKALVFISLLILILGFGLLRLGLEESEVEQIATPPPHLVRTESTPLAESGENSGIEGEQAYVTKVIDGDTIELRSGQRVRLLGIDTPETKDPRKPVQCFGKQAAAKTKELLEGKIVILQIDISETDKYNRLLRYVFLPINEGYLFVNDYLIREGFAKALTYPPDVKYNEQFREAERQAREESRGLWGRC